MNSAPLSAAAAASTAASPSLLASLGQNVHVVGSAWIVLSSLVTTYATTKFLKHEGIGSNGVSALTGRPDASLSDRQNNAFPRLSRPALLTLSRFSGSLLLGLVAWNPQQRLMATLRSVPPFLMPALFLFVAHYSNTLSLNRVGISLTYTSKCAIPLMTVVLTVLLDGWKALPSRGPLLSLVPIALGIAAASWNSPTMDNLGFLAAMISCVSQSALNVSCKRAMITTGLRGPQAQRAMVVIGFILASCMSYLPAVLSQLQHRWMTERSTNDSTNQMSMTTDGTATISTTTTSLAPSANGANIGSLTTNSVVVPTARVMAGGGTGGGLANGTTMPSSNRSPPASASSHSPSTVAIKQHVASSPPPPPSPQLSSSSSPPPLWLTGLAVSSYHFEYMLSFMFVNLVAPITYGTCDAIRRLSIIITGRCMFGGKPLSLLNMSGIGLALLGALSYSITTSSSS